jgi:hypothetical protein
VWRVELYDPVIWLRAEPANAGTSPKVPSVSSTNTARSMGSDVVLDNSFGRRQSVAGSDCKSVSAGFHLGRSSRH